MSAIEFLSGAQNARGAVTEGSQSMSMDEKFDGVGEDTKKFEGD